MLNTSHVCRAVSNSAAPKDSRDARRRSVLMPGRLELRQIADGLRPLGEFPVAEVTYGLDVHLREMLVVGGGEALQRAHRGVEDLREGLRLPGLVQGKVDVHVGGHVALARLLRRLARDEAARDLEELPVRQVTDGLHLPVVQRLGAQRGQALQRIHGLGGELLQGARLRVLVEEAVEVPRVGRLRGAVLLLQDLDRVFHRRSIGLGLFGAWLASLRHGGARGSGQA
mmetsp:Transcript_37905/g.107203  ORF Transcript_37905/g.107203 Transcript_37905/m.107203 type:complete len:227 (+) Transcript_37905:58-738(+)